MTDTRTNRTMDTKRLTYLLQKFPKPIHTKLSYGTAGFRCRADLLPSTFLRMGCLAAVLSRRCKGKAIGIMCTASHNADEDNGIKIADVDGGMLRSEWEGVAGKLANMERAEDVIELLVQLESNNVRERYPVKSVVHVGFDGRVHSPLLANLAATGASCCYAQVVNHGLVTTPILHHCVYQYNNHLADLLSITSNEYKMDVRRGFIGTYLDVICRSYVELISTCSHVGHHPQLYVDCACGIGAPFVKEINARLRDFRSIGAVELFSVNRIGDGTLNDQCGAEFVQKQKKFPTLFQRLSSHDQESFSDLAIGNKRWASLDGDADRIVFYFSEVSQNIPFHSESSTSLRLIDGDKIAALIALFIRNEIDFLQKGFPVIMSGVRCGVVQTAYANGSSTRFLEENGIDVKIAKTGVKFVHASAHDNFDVGKYFEANGHGTVLFSNAFLNALRKCENQLRNNENENVLSTSRTKIALKRLQILPVLINQAVGDSLSDLLLVEAILKMKSDSSRISSMADFQSWYSLYEDLPSRQLKVKVKDRTTVKTNENETKALLPKELQPALDNAVRNANTASNNTASRCFVRPSGTEDAVRIYAEAATQNHADKLAHKAVSIVQDICDGSNSFRSKL